LNSISDSTFEGIKAFTFMSEDKTLRRECRKTATESLAVMMKCLIHDPACQCLATAACPDHIPVEDHHWFS